MERIRCPNPKCGRHILDIEEMPPGETVMENLQCAYTVRTLAAAMTLGFIGLLASAASKSTIVGFLVSFCWYLALQTEHIGVAFKCVSKGISVYQVLLLTGSAAVVLFLSRHPEKCNHRYGGQEY